MRGDYFSLVSLKLDPYQQEKHLNPNFIQNENAICCGTSCLSKNLLFDSKTLVRTPHISAIAFSFFFCTLKLKRTPYLQISSYHFLLCLS